METDKIEKNLRERFAQPLCDHYKRRIIFWHDPEGEFAEFADSIDIPDVKLLKLTGTNNFAAKMLLVHTDTSSDYLVYDPVSYTDIQDNWLYDIERYSESFRADLLSLRMSEMSLPDTAQMRKAVKLYGKFFGNKERREKLSAFDSSYDTAMELHLNVLAVLTGAKKNTVSAVIRKILIDEICSETNQSLENIRKFGSEQMLWEIIGNFTGYTHNEGEPLKNMAAHLLLTAQSSVVKKSHMSGLENYISEVHSANCHAVVQEWMRSDDDGYLYETAREIEEMLSLEERFDRMEISELLECECFPCINECILKKYFTAISENVTKPEDISETVEKRRTMKWYKRVQPYYDGLFQIANMQRFYQNNISGFHFSDHSEMWESYTSEYYKMDTYYRKFHIAFGKCLKFSTTILEDLYRTAADYAEDLYKNRFLHQLNSKWTSVISTELEHSARLRDIPLQENFFRNTVSPLAEQGRIFVLISDALRYETAVELTETLMRETKGNAEISAMQSVVPSVTKFGMAALLPHSRLEINEKMQILCDGMMTDGTENREKILKNAESRSLAVTYKKLLMMSRSERREYFENARIVYIYHDLIDAVGDKFSTENEVFEACENTIAEIKDLVRMITSEHHGTNIIITADHGFLYSYKPLSEYDKSGEKIYDDDICELDHRYMIGKSNCSAEGLIKIPLECYNSNYAVFAAPECIRIRKQGGGINYVHGGISLQEMCVPVVTYKNVRAGSKQFVKAEQASIAILTQSRKISNNVFSLDFYQKEKVGGKILPAEYELCMRNSNGTLVSDKRIIIADKTNENSSDRTFRVRFMLSGIEFKKTESYYLTITEKDKKDVIERIEFTIDIAFTNDFGF